MYLMMYVDEAGKIVYTLKVRGGACAPAAAPPPHALAAEGGAGRQGDPVGAPGAVLAGRQVLKGAPCL